MKKLLSLITSLVLIASALAEFPKGFPLKEADVEFYKPTEMYQMPNLGGFIHPSYNGQTWNLEFPWRTGGLDSNTNNAKTYKFIKRNDSRIKTHLERGRFFSDPDYINTYRKWNYPKGWTVGEVIQINNKTTEIGLIKFTGKEEPEFELWRPFETVKDLGPWIVSERKTIGRLANGHTKSIVDETGIIHEITLDLNTVDEILARPFKNVIDKPFSKTDDLYAYAPTTRQAKSIVPINSDRGFFNSKACLSCHKTAGMEGRLLDPNPTPDKYGTIRGGGFIFSVPESIIFKQ